MLEKDMFLKNKYIFLTLFFIFIIKSSLASERNNLTNVIDHLSNLNNFSVSFLQNNNQEISEGKISIGNKRVRVDYKTPTKILIILDKDKAMYYNYELDEDEFFNPKDTPAWFFYDIFNNLDFFNEAKIISSNNNLVLEKIDFNKTEKFKIEVFFEDNPLILRRIKLEVGGEYLSLSILDHKYNETFDKSFFKLINPSFFE